jgi:hypothetical protein
LIFLKNYDIIYYNQKKRGKKIMMTVIYLDDYGRKHITTLQEVWELNILKERFSLIKVEVLNEKQNTT